MSDATPPEVLSQKSQRSRFRSEITQEIEKPDTGEKAARRIVAGGQRIGRLQRDVERASMHDALTGLNNRKGFDEELRRQMALAIRENRKIALLMIDLDNFKKINDELGGHVVGDKILRSFGQILAYTIRKTDFAARYGGDEFAVILPFYSAETAEGLRARLELVLRSQATNTPFLDKVGVSIGFAEYSPSTVGQISREGVVMRADQAMYKAKELPKSPGSVKLVSWEPKSQNA